jgi:hypothetical protein
VFRPDFSFVQPFPETETLVGAGTSTVVIGRVLDCPPEKGNDCWHFVSASYTISPVPEPTTLLLWGTGAAGLGVARWLKRRNSTSNARREHTPTTGG